VDILVRSGISLSLEPATGRYPTPAPARRT
jgi:hypothetical protein